MNIDRARLLEAIATSLDRLSNRHSVSAADMDLLAIRTSIGELLRSEQPDRVRDLYATGYALAQRLVALGSGDSSRAADCARLARLSPAILETLDAESSQVLFLELKSILSSLVAGSGYPSNPDDALAGIVFELCAWEAEWLTLPDVATTAAKQARDPGTMLQASARAQGGRFGNARVLDVTPLTGGFGNETTLFKLSDSNGECLDLVARASTGLPLGIEGRDISGEFFLLRYLHQSGVRVAEPLWLEPDIGKYGAKFLVTRKIAGDIFGTVVQARRLDSSQIRALATELAKIHALPLDTSHPDLQRSHIDMALSGQTTTAAVGNYLDRWTRVWQSTGLANSPAIEATQSWLRFNLPRIDDAPVLVHGDYGLHNILLQGDEIGGVLDWEMSHLGDRAEDISGLLTSFPDSADADAFFRYYLEAGGKPVTDFQLEYFNVFRHFTMYVVMMESQLRFHTLPELRPELLVLGSNYIQGPARRLAQVIERAEATKARSEDVRR